MNARTEQDCAADGECIDTGAAVSASLARFDLGGHACRIVNVSGVVPTHVAGSVPSRPRLVYLPGEVAHFDWDGERFSLVIDRLLPVGAPHACETDTGAPADAWSLLTNRELQIVQLIAMGMLTKQVADRLHISEFTVRSYLKTIYCKLGVRTRGALVFKYAQTFNPTSMSSNQL